MDEYVEVSVLMITYNHERFIAQAIASVLMQQTTFRYEIVIGEDCSTDGTRAIIEQFQQQHPDRIRVLRRDRNLGMVKNFADTYAACRGKYIAMLEGDDFWTDPHKLHTMVSFLHDNPQYAICFHRVRAFYDTGERPDFLLPVLRPKDTTTVTELLPFTYITTTSAVVFRKNITCFPKWFFTLNNYDHALHILNAQHGLIKFFAEPMGCYRLHTGSVWSSRAEEKKKIATAHDSLVHLLYAYPYKYQDERHVLCMMYYALAMKYAGTKETQRAYNALMHCLRHYRYKRKPADHPTIAEIIELSGGLLIQTFLPSTYPTFLYVRRILRTHPSVRFGDSTVNHEKAS